MAKIGKSKPYDRNPEKQEKPPTTINDLNPGKQEKPPTTINDLSTDCFSYTLSKIPVRNIMMSKCVSKSWSSMIDDPGFVKNHIRFNSSENEVLICESSFDSNSNKKKRVSLLRINTQPVTILEIDKKLSKEVNFLKSIKNLATQPDFPQEFNFSDFSKNMAMAGSVNGIVCLYHNKELSNKVVAVWNPATMYWKPVILPKANNWKNFSIGLGFDNVNDDYKIIFIVPFWLSGSSRVEIYSVNDDCWENGDKRRIVSLCAVRCLACKFVVQGFPYWTGVDKELGGFEILATIDPSNGAYKRYEYPKHTKGFPVYPVNLRDSIAALIEPSYNSRARMVDLYVLDTRTSEWTKMYCIGPLECGGFFIPQSLSGKIIIVTMTIGHFDKVTYFCDPIVGRMLRQKETEKLDPSWHESYAHVDSLVQLNGMIPIGNEHIDKTNRGLDMAREFSSVHTVHDFTVKDVKGNDVEISKFKGKVLLIVNVASQCGLTTSNYTELAELYQKYKDQGLEILAFPCNQFNGQEPGTNEEIENFVCTRFKAEYPIFSKVDVNGSDAAPLYKYLKSVKGDEIEWNFAKFLVDKDGKLVERYAPTTTPLTFENDIKKVLGVA